MTKKWAIFRPGKSPAFKPISREEAAILVLAGEYVSDIQVCKNPMCACHGYAGIVRRKV